MGTNTRLRFLILQGRWLSILTHNSDAFRACLCTASSLAISARSSDATVRYFGAGWRSIIGIYFCARRTLFLYSYVGQSREKTRESSGRRTNGKCLGNWRQKAEYSRRRYADGVIVRSVDRRVDFATGNNRACRFTRSKARPISFRRERLSRSAVSHDQPSRTDACMRNRVMPVPGSVCIFKWLRSLECSETERSTSIEAHMSHRFTGALRRYRRAMQRTLILF